MKYGFIMTTGDPRTIADLAADAEAAGWDGVFYWDGISIGDMDTYDTWVVLAAVASRRNMVDRRRPGGCDSRVASPQDPGRTAAGPRALKR